MTAATRPMPIERALKTAISEYIGNTNSNICNTNPNIEVKANSNNMVVANYKLLLGTNN